MTTKTRTAGAFLLRSTKRALASSMGVRPSAYKRVISDLRMASMTPASLFDEACAMTLYHSDLALKKVMAKK